ncbi:MAG: hypothetical protein K2X39_09525, partial [Silvanigrellaceae bacterium]|nr:hypothetical protein [Silvanigrellaceae bacterium]
MFSSVFEILFGVVERGFIGALLVMSVYLTSRIMKFDDFTIEGTFGLGGAIVAASLILGFNPWLALLLGGLCGGFSGFITGFLHTKLGLNKLISGIVVTTMLFSISLNIGSANVALGKATTIFSDPFFTHERAFLLFGLAIFSATFLWWLLKTEVGLMLRSTGENEQFVTSLGKSVPFYITLSLI